MRAKSTNGSVHAYQRIQGAIRKCIESGDLRPGDAVTSERELARIHRVSLMTVRHAFDSLEREGVVEHRRGVGTFVSAPKTHFNKLMSYTELMAGRGLLARSNVVYSGVLNDEYEIATRLSLPSTGPLIRVERVRLAADEPFALETCFVSAKEFTGMADAILERSSLFATLKQEYEVELAYADEQIDVTGSGCENSEVVGSSGPELTAPNQPAFLHHQGQSRHVRTGPLPAWAARAGDSAVSIISEATAANSTPKCVASSAGRE